MQSKHMVRWSSENSLDTSFDYFANWMEQRMKKFRALILLHVPR